MAVRRVRPPLDPELAAGLAAVQAQGIPINFRPENLQDVRKTGREGLISDRELRELGIDFEEFQVPGHAGGEISLLICWPAGLSKVAAAIYYIHGGGMVMAGNRVGIEGMLDWATEFGMVVVSVEYRVAPEYPDPTPVEDCYAGLVWTADHAEELGIAAPRILVAGISAGGGLAAATALMARDRQGPALLGQLLVCPMLDDREATPSSTMLDQNFPWDRGSNDMGWNALLGARRGGPDVSAYAAPARSTDLAGLPSAFIDVGSVDTFRDESVEYASRIWQAGGTAELNVWPGGFHGFEGVVPQAALSQMANRVRTDWLRRLLAAPQ
ncbi:alpha/beta hydrolase [Streptomyces phaeochromogenes]|uniref:alpha/beta hydrolase n=1 Tax=Streptomyces phaeochromogenes TaxID=1923 RepID=UPI00398D1A17